MRLEKSGRFSICVAIFKLPMRQCVKSRAKVGQGDRELWCKTVPPPCLL